jgi:hypothetical protein
VKWSIGIEAQGDRVITREEVVELADAVAASSGIATGIGTNRYGAQLLVEAVTRDEAIEKARAEFARAVGQAGLPDYPIVRVEAAGEDEDGDDAGAGGDYGRSEGGHAGGHGEQSSGHGEHSGGHGKDAAGHGKDSGGLGEDPGGRRKDSGG